MSEDKKPDINGDNQDGQSEEDPQNVCRDFLRNVCFRGRRCKFVHPKSHKVDTAKITFCQDFQKQNCYRSNCKFLHCTHEEEEFFRATGELPPDVLEAGIRMGIISDSAVLSGVAPVCKDYLNGVCKRGTRCKFRHLSQEAYDDEWYKSNRHGYDNRYMGPPEPKRFRQGYFMGGPGGPSGGGGGGGGPEVGMLQEENAMLRQRLHDLHRQLDDLSATNELLLDQNTRLRMEKKKREEGKTMYSSGESSGLVSYPIMNMKKRAYAYSTTEN